MALPPTIPTSFVPKQPVQAVSRRQKSGSNLFMIVGAGIAGIALVLAAGVFAYEFYLESSRDRKAASLTEAQQSVNLDTVEDFIRLRNRLNSVDQLLDRHIELSSFFDVLEAKTLQTVRFSSLNLTVAEDRSAEIEMEGVARSFNALAAQSAAIASEKRIKRAIFSGISVNANGTVGFTLTATMDSRLITSGGLLPGVVDTASVAPTVPAATQQPVRTATSSVPAATTTRPANATTTPSL